MIVYFRNIQLSWNPALFRFAETTHNFWPKDQGPTNDIFNVGENPQYVLTLSNDAISKKATIWVLISRHVSKQEQEGSEVRKSKYQNMAMFYIGCDRVAISPSPFFHAGDRFLDNTHDA